MKNKISNSALDCYQTCPKKYYFQYVEGYKADITKTPLLFGTAIDSALNYILEALRDKKDWSEKVAKDIFYEKMKEWKGQNRLDFFKNEIPEDIDYNFYDQDNLFIQEKVWDLLFKRGIDCLNVYIDDILPQINQVLHVQHKFDIPNEEGDIFTGVIDFIAKLKDGRTVLFDNKTSSSKYPKNKVVTSQQLSFYMDQFPDIKYAGYIVLIKNPEKEKGLTHQILIDEIPEETIANSFKLLDETMQKIKREEFPCNYKACKKFGKPCEYERLCSYNDPSGLIKLDKKRKE